MKLSLVASEFKNQIPGINKGTIFFAIASILFYAVALFPSRNHLDTVTILELARSDKSLDQWTASYFRFLDLLSFGGKYGMIPAIFGLVGLVLAFLFFISSFKCSSKVINLVTRIFLFSPYLGVFGMTLTHEVQATTAILILSGVLVRLSKIGISINSDYKFIIIISALLISMIHNGFCVFIAFAIAYVKLKRDKKVFMLLISFGLASLTLFGHNILDVTEQSKAMRYQSLLGDIKCIVQHPDAKISPSDWKILLNAGSYEDWIAPSTCSYSRVFFAFPWVEKNQIATVKLWLKLSIQNPQLSIEARLQRSANALPPLFFKAPQSAIAVNYLKPAGIGTQDDLLIWSPLFKTSNDDYYQREQFKTPKYLAVFEAFAILPAHLMNRNSSFWGWGGMWLTIAWFALYLNGNFKIRESFLILLPQIFSCLSVIMFAPVSDPRYTMNVTLPSIVIAVLFITEFIRKARLILALCPEKN